MKLVVLLQRFPIFLPVIPLTTASSLVKLCLLFAVNYLGLLMFLAYINNQVFESNRSPVQAGMLRVRKPWGMQPVTMGVSIDSGTKHPEHVRL